MKKSNFETLPEHLIQRILEFFQTKKIIKVDKDLTDHDLNQRIVKSRKNLINGKGIRTDLKSIMNFSITCRRFNDIIKSDSGKLIFTVHYNSKEFELMDVLSHISYCHDLECRNICHYVNKDIKHTNIIKKIAVDKFNELKNTEHKENLVTRFKMHLTSKQIESYYKIKKMNMKLKDISLNEKTKFSKSSELDAISLYSDSESDS
jgi:hypothetical protein